MPETVRSPRRSASLRSRLILLVAAITAPLFGFGLLSTYLEYHADRARVSRQELELARSMAQSVGDELHSAIAALQALSLAQPLQVGDFERFRAIAEAFLAQQPNSSPGLTVMGRDGAALFYTPPLPPGKPVTGADPALSARVFDTGQPSVSELHRTVLGGRPTITIDVPVFHDGRVVFDLAFRLAPQRFATLLARQNVPTDWVVSIFDATGTTVEQVPNGGRFLGSRASPDFYPFLTTEAEGVRPTHALEGTSILTAWSHVAPYGWSVAIGIPEQNLVVPARRSALITLAIGGVMLVIGLLAATVLARRIAGPIASLTRVAEAAEGEGRIISHTTGLREVDDVADALHDAAIRRRVAERAGRESAMLASRLLETTPSATIHVARSGAILYANPAAERLLALSQGNIGRLGLDSPVWGTHGADGQPIASEDRPARRALRGEIVRDMEIVIVGSDGMARVILANAAPIGDPRGGIGGALVAMTDVTARHQAETSLRDLVSNLEQRVVHEVATREAAQAQAQHAQQMQALGQLAGGVAHDMNNVLQSVSGALELISKRADAPGVRRLAELAADAAERGAGVVRRLLTFSRQGDLRAESLEPATLLAGLREMLVHALDPAIVVRIDVPPDLQAILADRIQLETVLVNLTTNARDAMPDGGTLILRAAPQAVGPDTALPGDARLVPGVYLRFEVADNGWGMDAATLARACEPFFTTKAIDRGTGLGLAMARGFAEQSGGALAIASTPGRGTVVSLWLPATQRHAAQPMPGDWVAPVRASGTRVLLVDDEPLVRDVLSKQLRDSGCVVRDVAGAEGALAALDANEFDVLVSDLAMPGMNGLDLIREARHRRPGLPSVLLTGYAGDAARYAAARGMPSERFALLRKPISGDRLADEISVLLSMIEVG